MTTTADGPPQQLDPRSLFLWTKRRPQNQNTKHLFHIEHVAAVKLNREIV
jgi:hypothetical protein